MLVIPNPAALEIRELYLTRRDRLKEFQKWALRAVKGRYWKHRRDHQIQIAFIRVCVLDIQDDISISDSSDKYDTTSGPLNQSRRNNTFRLLKKSLPHSGIFDRSVKPSCRVPSREGKIPYRKANE